MSSLSRAEELQHLTSMLNGIPTAAASDKCQADQEKDRDPNREVNIGDVVRLSSYGPRMTVVSVGELGVGVAWFTQSPQSELKTAILPRAALEHC